MRAFRALRASAQRPALPARQGTAPPCRCLAARPARILGVPRGRALHFPAAVHCASLLQCPRGPGVSLAAEPCSFQRQCFALSISLLCFQSIFTFFNVLGGPFAVGRVTTPTFLSNTKGSEWPCPCSRSCAIMFQVQSSCIAPCAPCAQGAPVPNAFAKALGCEARGCTPQPPPLFTRRATAYKAHPCRWRLHPGVAAGSRVAETKKRRSGLYGAAYSEERRGDFFGCAVERMGDLGVAER